MYLRLARCSILLSLIFTLASSFEIMAVEVRGDVAGEWTVQNSPYVVTDNLRIPNQQRLTIEPGVEIRFNPSLKLIVNGSIVANGNADNPIIFTWNQQNQPWGGIRIINPSDDNSFRFCQFTHSHQTANYPVVDSRGGAIYADRAQIILEDCLFQFNRAEGIGGAVCCFNSNGEFNRNVLTDNYGYSEIVWFEQSHFNVVDCLFEDNVGPYCAGLEFEGGGGLIENNRFIRNTSTNMTWGNAIYLVHGADPIVRNNLIVDNIGGGAMFIGYDAHPRVFEHNTIVNNTGRCGIFVVYDGDMAALNCIFWDNEGSDIELYQAGASLSYSDFQDGNGVNIGDGRINQDPLFTDPQHGDYSLQINSPCRDAGDPNSPDDPDGTRADMGYYFQIPAQVTVSEDIIRFDPVARGERVVKTFILRYNEGVRDEIFLQFRPADGDDFFRVSPPEETMELGDSLEIRVILEPTDQDELGLKQGTIEVFIEEGADPFLLIPVEGFFVEGFGRIFGRAVDVLSELPVAGTTVNLVGFPNHPYGVETDENGVIDLGHIPSWHYLATITHPDYETIISDSIFLGVGEDFELDMLMHYAAAEIDQNELIVSLQQGEQTTRTIALHNPGSARLNFSASRIYPDIEGVEYLGLTETIDIEQILHDTRIQGLEVVGDKLYVCGGNSGAGTGKIYVIDKNHNLIDQFDQFTPSNFGIRDLCWDGELIWGIDQGVVYSFTTEGELVNQFESPTSPGRNITWDTERELLWISDVTSDYFQVDRDGNMVARIRRPVSRVYGVSCLPGDPDGARLYLYANDPEHPHSLSKFNPDNGEYTFLADLPAGAALAGGSSFSNNWSPMSLQFVGLLKNGIQGDGNDQVGFFHISAREDWLSIAPAEGFVRAGATTDLEVTFDASNFPEALLSAQIIITHNGRGDRLEIPITLLIRAEGDEAVQNLRIRRGWSLISLNLSPHNADIRDIFRPLVDLGILDIVKDASGRFYKPSFGGFCNIPRWNPPEGYIVRSSDASILRIGGNALREDEPIPLHQGWQTVAYYPHTPNSPAVAFANVAEELVLAKDVSGAFYSPRWGFASLNSLSEGNGYWVLMSRATNLIWQSGEMRQGSPVPLSPIHFTDDEITGSDMSVLLLTSEEMIGEVGVYSRGKLIGSGTIQNGKCGFAIRGLDEMTGQGANEGDPLTFVYWNGTAEFPAIVRPVEGKTEYRTNSFLIADLTGTEVQTVPDVYELHAPSPNPFNSSTALRFDMPSAGEVSLRIFDLQGRLIETLVDGQREAGVHAAIWVAGNSPAGTYLCRMESGKYQKTVKFLLVR